MHIILTKATLIYLVKSWKTHCYPDYRVFALGSVSCCGDTEVGLDWVEGTEGKAKTPGGTGKKNPGHWLKDRGDGKALNRAEECSW